MKKFATALLCLAAALPAAAAEVEMHTSKGLIVLDIDEENAPATAANFLQYARDGFFDGVIFHRIIPGFVIQGGGFEPGMQKRETRAPIQFEETGLKNAKYSISMARTNDPHSATSQFFINLNDNRPLDGGGGQPGYAVFGKVVEGAEVVDEIATVQTGNQQRYRDVPLEDIIIEKAVVRGGAQ